MYTVITPMLNPFIYSLRNKDIKGAMKRFFVMESLKRPMVLGLERCPWLKGSKLQSVVVIL